MVVPTAIQTLCNAVESIQIQLTLEGCDLRLAEV